MDLDTYVEELNPNYSWENPLREMEDQSLARDHFVEDIEENLRNDLVVVAIGERFLTTNYLSYFLGRLRIGCSVYLYHLSVLLSLRRQWLDDDYPQD